MSDARGPALCPSLYGERGELLSITIPVSRRRLEELLAVIARLSYPVNAHVYQARAVGFMLYRKDLPELVRLLEGNGFDASAVEVAPALKQAAGF